MKKINAKQKNIWTILLLSIVGIILVFAIYLKLDSNKQEDIMPGMSEENNLIVEDIMKSKEPEAVVEVPEVEPEEINESEKSDDVVIEEPMPTEPDKPELDAPDVVPQTEDDVEDMTKIPEYNEEEVVIEGEEVVVTEEEVTEEQEESESTLIPPSENPFANPDNAGNPTEVDGEDYYEDGRKAGEGDKF